MGTLGMIGAVAVGVAATLAAPVMVWALVISGLGQVTKKDARRERQTDLETRRVEA